MQRKDIKEITKLAIAVVPAMVLSLRGCRWLARNLAWLTLRTRPSRFRARQHLIATALSGDRRGAQPISARRIQLDLITNSYDAEYFLPLRFHRPGHWTPKVRLSGGEHIEEALAAGSGVILWVYPFLYYSIITKIALARADYPAVHLSRQGHGYSKTRFGIRYLNPIKTKVENLHLAERIVLDREHWTRGLRSLVRRLQENNVVTITADAHGRKKLPAPLFHGMLHLATGAPNLAISTNAALLPAMTVREPNGQFVVHVEPALHKPADAVSLHDGEIAMIRQFARVLETYVRRYPDQWPDWHYRFRWTT